MLAWEGFSFKQELNEKKTMACTTEVRLSTQLDVLPMASESTKYVYYLLCLLLHTQKKLVKRN